MVKKKVDLALWSRRKFFVGTPLPTRGRPPPPSPTRGGPPSLFFFFAYPPLPQVRHGTFFGIPHYTTPSPTRDMELFSPNALQIWPQKGPLGPFWRSNLCPGRLRHPGGASLAPLRGPGGALAPEYTLRKGLTWPDSPHPVSTLCRKTT